MQNNYMLYILWQGQEYTEKFLLEYQREEGGEWMRFRDKAGNEVCKIKSLFNIFVALKTEKNTCVIISTYKQSNIYFY